MSITAILFMATIPALAFWNYRLFKRNVELSRVNRQLRRNIKQMREIIAESDRLKFENKFVQVAKIKLPAGYREGLIEEIHADKMVIDDPIYREMLCALNDKAALNKVDSNGKEPK